MYEALGLKVPFQWYNVQQMPELCGAAVVHNSFQTVGLSARDHERKQNDCTDSGADLCAHAPGSWLRTSALNSSRFFQKLTSLVKPLDFLDCPEHPWAQDRTKLSKRHGAVSVGELEPRVWSRNELHFFQISFLFGHCFRGIESSHGSESLRALEVSESWILGIWHGRGSHLESLWVILSSTDAPWEYRFSMTYRNPGGSYFKWGSCLLCCFWKVWCCLVKLLGNVREGWKGSFCRWPVWRWWLGICGWLSILFFLKDSSMFSHWGQLLGTVGMEWWDQAGTKMPVMDKASTIFDFYLLYKSVHVWSQRNQHNQHISHRRSTR